MFVEGPPIKGSIISRGKAGARTPPAGSGTYHPRKIQIKKTIPILWIIFSEQGDGKAGKRISRAALSWKGGGNFPHVFLLLEILQFKTELL